MENGEPEGAGSESVSDSEAAVAPSWAVYVPAALIILVLAALAVTPLWVQRDSEAYRQDIEQTVAPARTMVTRRSSCSRGRPRRCAASL